MQKEKKESIEFEQVVSLGCGEAYHLRNNIKGDRSNR